MALFLCTLYIINFCRTQSSEDTNHNPLNDQNAINVVRERRKRARQLMDSDSESDGNDQADKSVDIAEEDTIRSQPATAGSLHHQLESAELTENTVLTVHEFADAATEGSMPELAFSQTASSLTDMQSDL